MLGRRASRRARARTPAFCQLSDVMGSVLIAAADKPAQPTTSSHPPTLGSSSLPLKDLAAETLAFLVLHLID